MRAGVRTTRTTGAAPLALSLLPVACHDLPEVRYRGERVAIAPYDDAPVCGGTVAELDRTVRDLENATGLQVEGEVTFYWGWDGVWEHCSDVAFSCAEIEKRRVFGMMTFARHELAHVVGGQVGQAIPIVEEAFAVAYGERCSKTSFEKGWEDFVDVDDEAFAKGGLAVGGHLALFLGREQPLQRIVDLKDRVPYGKGREALHEAFVEVYGESLASAEARERAESPFTLCAKPFPPADETWDGTSLDLEARLDCDDTSTMGPLDQTTYLPPSLDSDIEEAMYSLRRVLFPFVDRVNIAVDGPAGSRAMLQSEYCSAYARDLPEDPFEVAAGEEITLEMSACTWLIYLVADSRDPASVGVRITEAD